MKYQITLLNEPNQRIDCNLTDDYDNMYQLELSLRTLPDGQLLADLSIDSEGQRFGVICHDRMPLIPNNVLNGNIYFEDLYGKDDPVYNEFNDRFVLVYDTEFVIG